MGRGSGVHHRAAAWWRALASVQAKVRAVEGRHFVGHADCNRLRLRGRQDDSLDIQKIKQRDERELSWGLGEVIDSADIVISNEDSIEELRKRVEDFFSSL